MPSVRDWASVRQGNLLVIRQVDTRSDGQSMWECRCDCGATCIKSSGNLRQGIKSCSTRCGISRSNRKRAKHGLARSKEWRAWCAAKQRCHNPKNPQYENYGGRGITMCKKWRGSFAAFIDHIGLAPSGKHTLDRINNDKGYEPGNVRWVTATEQLNNTRRNRYVFLGDRKLGLGAAAKEFGLTYACVNARVRRGLTGWDVVSPVKTGRERNPKK